MESAEPISRFLFSKSDFSSQNNLVKLRAYLPPPDLTVSVFRTQGLNEEQTWELAERKIISRQKHKKTLKGRADSTPSKIENVGLNIIPDNIPPRHANITGWPVEKDEQKMLAAELANKSTLVLKSISESE